MDSYLPEDYYDLNYNGRTKLSIFLIHYSKKGKKTKQKSNKSIAVPNDDTEQTEAGNNRRQTCSTTLKTKNSDNDSEPDGDRTITDENLEEGKNETADDEQNDEQLKLDTSIGKRSKRKRKVIVN